MVKDSILKNRIYGLDLMRSAAMVCVILTHSGFRTIFGMRYGIVAVESFFVVSGFLIGGILLRDFKEEVTFKNVSHFWKKRWFRTLPLYYAVLLIKFIFIDHSIGFNIFYYFTFLQSNIYGIQFLPVSWTLVVEEWFYLLIPILFIVFFRKGINPKKFYVLIALFVLLANLLRFAWVMYTDYPYGAMAGNFVFRMDSNFIGVALAGIKMFDFDVFKNMAKLKYFIPATLFTVALFVMFGLCHGGSSAPDQQYIWVRTIWFSLISMSAACMIPFFYCSPIYAPKEGKQAFRWLVTWLSLLSYPIYLVHVDIYVLMNRTFPIFNEINFISKFLIQNTVVVIVGLLLYHLLINPY